MQTQTTGLTPDRTPRTGTGRAALALLLAVLGTGAARVSAQQVPPPDLVRGIAQPNASQEAQIKAFVDDRVPGLSAPEAAKIKRARQDLLEPLFDSNVSAPFRLAYSKQLDAPLTQLTADKRDIVVINALIIAGELATEQGLTVVEKKLNDPDQVIRYTAARALGQTLEAVDRTAPAIIADRAERIIATIGKQIESEKELRVVDTLARGLAAAVNFARADPGWPAVRVRAVRELSNRLGSRMLHEPDHNGVAMLLDTAVTSGFAIRTAVGGGGGNNAARLPDEARCDAAQFAGDTLWFVSRAIRAAKDFLPPQPDDDPAARTAHMQSRELASRAAGLGEAIAALTVQGYRDQGLADMVRKGTNGDDAQFLNGVDQTLDALSKQCGTPRDRWGPR